VAHSRRDSYDARFPHPLCPIGSRSIFVLDKRRIEMMRQIGKAWNPVVNQIGVQRLAMLVLQGLKKGMSQSLNSGAFILPFLLRRVERLPDIGHGDIASQCDLPRV